MGLEIQSRKVPLVNNPGKLCGFDSGYDILFSLISPSPLQVGAKHNLGELESCYCSSGWFSCFLVSSSAQHWLQPCILVQLLTLCSAASRPEGFFSVRLSSSPNHTRTHTNSGTFRDIWHAITRTHTHTHTPSPAPARMTTCISAHKVTQTRSHIQRVRARRVWQWL